MEIWLNMPLLALPSIVAIASPPHLRQKVAQLGLQTRLAAEI
jgi:hypothetical protein